MKYVMIVNPAAGRGVSESDLDYIEKEFKALKHDLEIYTTFSDKDFHYIINITQKTADAYVIWGGDGSIREMIKSLSLLDCNHPLGILPMGTGNDFAKSLYLPLDTKKNLKIILSNKTKEVFIANINEDFYVNIASMGLDAEIVALHNRLKKRFKNKISYLLSAIIKLFTYQAVDIFINYDGIKEKKDYLLVAVANGKYYGGGMKIAPDASLDKKKLQVCAVKKINKLVLFFLIPTLFSGRHKNLWCVDYFECDDIEIHTKDETHINIDGELKTAKFVKINKNLEKKQKIFTL